MRLPTEFLTPEDVEEMNTIGDSIEMLADIFHGQDDENKTTEGLRMAASLFRTGARRLEIIAERVENG
jgi:hypothetical protein